MLAERFGHSFCHEEVEGRNGLSSVLFILVCLENDGSQCGITLDGLRRTDASVLGVKSAFEQIILVILYAGSRLCGIIIQVVNMYVTHLMRFCIFFRKKIFVRIVLGEF